jgi:hypothetical protein
MQKYLVGKKKACIFVVSKKNKFMETSNVKKNVTVKKLTEYRKTYGAEIFVKYPYARLEKQANTNWLVCLDAQGFESRRFKIGTKLLCGWDSEKEITETTAKLAWAKERKAAANRESERMRVCAEAQAEKQAAVEHLRGEYQAALSDNLYKVKEAGITVENFASLWSGNQAAWSDVNHAVNLIGNHFCRVIGWKSIANDIQKKLKENV